MKKKRRRRRRRRIGGGEGGDGPMKVKVSPSHLVGPMKVSLCSEEGWGLPRYVPADEGVSVY